MLDWLLRMFDPAGFPARWHCGEWSSFLGWLHIGSDVATWLAYMGIPAVLLFFVRRHPDLPGLPVFRLFIVFIAACGLGHLVEATMFWWPAYRFGGSIKLVTAVVSVATLCALIPFARRAFAMPATRELLRRLGEETSAHERSQDDLHFTQEQLRMASVASGVGSWIWRGRPDFLAWDENTCTIFGLDPAVRSGGRDVLKRLVHPGDQLAVEEALGSSFEHGATLGVSFRIVRPDGRVAHVVARGSPVRDAAGRIIGLAGAFFDITKEEMSRALFQTAVEASPNALLMTDRNGDIVLANSQAETMFGYAREELAGSSIDRLVPEAIQGSHAALRERFHASPSRRRLGGGRDLACRRKDGREVPVEIALSPVQLQGGPGVLVAIADITERRELEAKLHQAERLAVVGELAAGVAHEINNPANTIVNCAQLVLDGDSLEDNCKVVIDEGMRIAGIVRELLQFARDDRATTQPTALREVVQRCLRLIGENLKRHGIALHVDVPEELPPVNGQSQQLQLVVLNLLINAKEGLVGDGADRPRRIDLTARAEGRSVRCAVRDNGPGVPPELQARIFQPFVTTKRACGGTGLGLSVSHSIVAGFGGTLAVRSVVGEFAEFTFELPQACDANDVGRASGALDVAEPSGG
jgi:PAS domain S-box-containing protein